MLLIAKNYRCFSQENPLRLELNKGVTSIIGLNNSGKSTIFRLVRELRSIWELISPEGMAKLRESKGKAAISFADTDKNSVFCSLNTNDMVIELHLEKSSIIEVASTQWVNKLIFTLGRDAHHWSIKFYSSGRSTVIDLNSWREKSGYHVVVDSITVSLKEAFEAASILKRCIYFDANRFVASKFGGHQADLLVGKSFIANWKQCKTGNDKALNIRVGLVQKDIRNIFQFGHIDISASTTEEDMVLYIEDDPAKLSEMGDGISQFIVTLGTAAIKQPSFILIDEPERGLHASMQLDFVTSLASYAEYGLYFSTHSMGLARSVSDAGIYSVWKYKNGSQLRLIELESNIVELLGSLNYSAYQELGFRKILLVEGTTEVKVFQQFLRKFRADHFVLILPLGGSSLVRDGVDHEMAEIVRLAKDSVYAIVDSERNSEMSDLDANRKGFKRICDSLNIPCLLTEYRATDNYFTDDAINRAFPNKSVNALGKYEKLSGQWKKSENWRIVRQMSKEEIEKTDIGEFIKKYLVGD